MAQAQPRPDAAIVNKLTSDLLPLKDVLTSDEPLRDGIYGMSDLQSLVTYGQNKVIRAYEKDLREFQFPWDRARRERVRKPEDVSIAFSSFSSQDQTYKLTKALAGRSLSEENLMPLAEAIAAMDQSALICRDSASPLRDSADFRKAAQNAHDALRAIGLSPADARIVTEALLSGGQAVVAPPIRVTAR
jgi:hypothetical protein